MKAMGTSLLVCTLLVLLAPAASAVSLTYSLKETGLEANKPFKLGNMLSANPMLAKVR